MHDDPCPLEEDVVPLEEHLAFTQALLARGSIRLAIRCSLDVLEEYWELGRVRDAKDVLDLFDGVRPNHPELRRVRRWYLLEHQETPELYRRRRCRHLCLVPATHDPDL